MVTPDLFRRQARLLLLSILPGLGHIIEGFLFKYGNAYILIPRYSTILLSLLFCYLPRHLLL